MTVQSTRRAVRATTHGSLALLAAAISLANVPASFAHSDDQPTTAPAPAVQPVPDAASASEPSAQPDTDQPGAEEQAKPSGILPIPDYSGDLWHRGYLTGDWGGARTNLANKGIQFNVDWVQTVQSVVDGGFDTGTEYGGSLDYLLHLDLFRMGVLPGALVKVRAESRYGNSVNSKSGSILPVNTDAFFPLTSQLDEDIPITVTALTYYQYLSDHFGMFAGKIDTLDSDLNEFASGRGTTQFMNSQLIFSGTMALLPYSTLGGGAMVMPTRDISITSSVFSLNDSSTTTGLTQLDEGWAWATQATFQYRLGTLPGGTNVGAIYLWGTEFFNFNKHYSFDPDEGLVTPTSNDTWIAYASGWQYLFVKDPTEGPLDLLNGQPDREGFGIFWRGAIADDNVNPIEWSISGGVGGKGMIPGREHDLFGIGYYYNRVQTSRLTSAFGLEDHTQGFECFYNMAITPAAQLTFDAQLIDSAQSNLDLGVVLGMRLKLEF